MGTWTLAGKQVKDVMRRSREAEGFTLIEIAVSVAILGLALTTLVALNTRMLDTYFNERNRVRASFYAQYLLTMIDAAAEAPELGSKNDSLRDTLEENGYFDEDELKAEKDPPESWTYEREVSSIAIAELDDALRRIDLSINWGPGADESFSMVYFVATKVDTSASGPFANLPTPSGTGSTGNTPSTPNNASGQ